MTGRRGGHARGAGSVLVALLTAAFVLVAGTLSVSASSLTTAVYAYDEGATAVAGRDAASEAISRADDAGLDHLRSVPGHSYDDRHNLARASAHQVGYRLAPQTGSISYGALDDLGRPTGVTARLTPDMVGTGSSAARSITPPGFGGGAAGHARGHLLGNQLGGSGADARNLVTMFQNPANSPVMRGFENQVRAALDAGQVVNYGATPIYRGTGLMPVGITLRAQGSGGLDFFLSVLNRGL